MDIDKTKYVVKIQNIFRNRVKIKNRINNEIALIKSKEPDLIIIANYHEIITSEIIEIPKI